MKLVKTVSIGILFGMCAFSFKKDEINPVNVEATGKIQQQGMTTYQYGTHVVAGYAVRSSTIDLDRFIGQTVTVVGHLIKGYPIEGGPDYLEVEEIK